MWLSPSCVLLRSSAVLAAVSFSNVTVACPVWVSFRSVILPLQMRWLIQAYNITRPGLPKAEKLLHLLLLCLSRDILHVDSEIGSHGDKYNDVAFTKNVRWSTRLNYRKLMDGQTDYIDLFKDGEAAGTYD